MSTIKKQPADSKKIKIFCIDGQIQREQSERQEGEIKLSLYAFDHSGVLLGTADLDHEGKYSATLHLAQPADITLFVGPSGMPQQIHLSSAYQRTFSAKDWKAEGSRFHLKFDVLLPPDIWRPWWPLRICISGHVQKVMHRDGFTDIGPVTFIKVEIFDVDREGCLWSPIRKWGELLLDRPVIRIPELLKEPPFPQRPLADYPIQGQDMTLDAIQDVQGEDSARDLERAALNPQQARSKPGIFINPATKAALDSQAVSHIALQPSFTRVGEMRLIENSIASRLDKLTITSKIAPWLAFPHCYHSKTELGETTTDDNGHFNYCFNWWPFLFRQGRLSFDSLPDIIVKVTQVINGVPTAIYLDPYTGTRWNANHAHIDLFLDDEEIICGTGHSYNPPKGATVFFTRIGDDEINKIDQSSGLYNDTPVSDIAYGSNLQIHGQFGDALSNMASYYRLSYAKHGSSDFTPINEPLTDTRFKKNTLQGETHALGPISVDDIPAMYELRNFEDYFWYNPDWLGTWQSWLTEANTGKYVLRLEVFDRNGVKLTTADGVDYRDGTAIPPATPAVMTDHCDLTITLDNKEPEVDLMIPAEINNYGVIPMNHGMSIDFEIRIRQENNRLRSWGFYYTRGTSPTIHELASGFSNNGLPGSIDQTIKGGTFPQQGTGMLANLNDHTCAYALKLWATAHIRDGRHFIYYQEQIKVFAVEKLHLE
ncbi:MAG: hypothetical protein WC216_05870 [Gallionella sp.]|jgi:hypothetical protein